MNKPSRTSSFLASTQTRARRSKIAGGLFVTLCALSLPACDAMGLDWDDIQKLMKMFSPKKKDETSKSPKFVSDNPNPNQGNQKNKKDKSDGSVTEPEKGEDNSDAPSGGNNDAGKNPGLPGNPAQNIIAEADRIQVEGDRLYALSNYRGLSIIDISDPAALKVIGEQLIDHNAFEMYVDQGRVFVMFNRIEYGGGIIMEDVADGVVNSAASPAHPRGALLALDARNPQAIRKLGQWNIDGRIEDSRRINDALYIVGYQPSQCWNCPSQSSTLAVHGFNVKDLNAPQEASKLSIPVEGYSWQAPSIITTDRHLYIASHNQNSKEGKNSTINLVDLSPEDASMKQAGQVVVDGAVQSRWQMSEYHNVLRVVAQRRWSSEPPVVETFDVTDSNAIAALGRMTMKLPRPEALQSVRFDGSRGYAITFERTDPLFTLDFSDPKAPKQVGELEIPGWVYHMVPRGNRLLGIGYERTNKENNLHASLFDVSDMAAPKMLSRAYFGGHWANFNADQNRIHKSLRVYDDKELLTIPFVGSERGEEASAEGNDEACFRHRTLNGVQLVDWKNDALVSRGYAQTDGVALRSFIHKDTMFTVSSQSVHSVDIQNRDKPSEIAKVNTTVNAANLYNIADDSPYRLRFSQQNGNRYQLQVVRKGEENELGAVGSVDLSAALNQKSNCNEYNNIGQGYVVQNRIHFWVNGGRHIQEKVVNEKSATKEMMTRYRWQGYSRFITVDFSDPTAPKISGISPDFSQPRGNHNSLRAFSLQEKNAVQRGSRLFWSTHKQEKDSEKTSPSIEVFDLSGDTVTAMQSIPRPAARYHGNFFVVDDNELGSWYGVEDEKDPSKLYFYWQRIFVSENSAARVENINVPGIPAAFNKNSSRLLSISFTREKLASVDSNECYKLQKSQEWDPDTQSCTLLHHNLHELRIEGDQAFEISKTKLEEEGLSISQVEREGDHMLLTYSPYRRWGWMVKPSVSKPGSSTQTHYDKDDSSDYDEDDSTDEDVTTAIGVSTAPAWASGGYTTATQAGFNSGAQTTGIAVPKKDDAPDQADQPDQDTGADKRDDDDAATTTGTGTQTGVNPGKKPYQPKPNKVVITAITDRGEVVSAEFKEPNAKNNRWTELRLIDDQKARWTTAGHPGISIVDIRNPQNMSIATYRDPDSREQYCWKPLFDGDVALCALGHRGVQRFVKQDES